MEERQLIKLEGWFKSQHISCLKIVEKKLNKILTWILLNNNQPACQKKLFLIAKLKPIIT